MNPNEYPEDFEFILDLHNLDIVFEPCDLCVWKANSDTALAKKKCIRCSWSYDDGDFEVCVCSEHLVQIYKLLESKDLA